MFGGSGEIRTLGTLSDSLVFKTSAIGHSTTLPSNWYPLSDSNRHDSPFERDASYQIGLRGHIETFYYRSVKGNSII